MTAVIRKIDRRRILAGAGAALVATTALQSSNEARAQTPVDAAAGGTRTIAHPLGTTEVPTVPRRFMILDNTVTIGYAASLGMLPAFALEQDLGREQPFPEDLYPGVAAVQPIPGDAGNVSLEAVAAARPDLIVFAAGYFDDAYDQLSRIAPTVALAYEWGGRDWENLRLLAEVLGVPERVAGVKRRYDDALDRAKARVSGAGKTVSFGALWHDGSVMVYEPGAYLAMRSAAQLGFELVPDFGAVGGAPGDFRLQLSAERITELSGDYLILLQATNSPDEQAAIEAMLGRPLFQALPAVRGDRVLIVSRLSASGAAGVDGWLKVLDRMVEFFDEEGRA